MSLRKDTLSHAYELMKVEDPKKRRRLAEQVARGELTLVKLREQDRGPPARPPRTELARSTTRGRRSIDAGDDARSTTTSRRGRARPAMPTADLRDDSLVNASRQLAEAIEELVGVLRAPDAVGSIADVDRANLAKYLTIAKLRLENAIASSGAATPTDEPAARPATRIEKPAPGVPASLLRWDV